MLSARGLTKSYAGRNAVNHAVFDLHPGTVTAVLGRDGAGKSTLFRMLCGLIRPTTGEVHVAGRAFADWPNPSHVVGAVLDRDLVHPGRTGRAQLRMAARLAGLPVRRVDEVVGMLGLESYIGRKAGTYGQSLRLWLNLAHALLPDPPVLLLDEPLNELKPEDVATVRALLRSHAERGGTVLLTSHVLSQVDNAADRALVINEGWIVADGPVSMLIRAETCQVQGSDNKSLAEVLRQAGVRIRPRQDGYLAVQLAADRVAELARKAGVRITGLREGERTLDEVLANLIGEF